MFCGTTIRPIAAITGCISLFVTLFFVSSLALAQTNRSLPYSQSNQVQAYSPGRLVIQFRAKPLKAALARKKALRFKDYLAYRQRLFRTISKQFSLPLDNRFAVPFRNIFNQAVHELVTSNLREWQLRGAMHSSQRGMKQYGIAEAFTVQITGDPVYYAAQLKKRTNYRLRDHFGAPISIRSVSPDYYSSLYAFTPPSIHPQQWLMEPFRATEGLNPWALTTGSSDTIVAVIDSGVDYNHLAVKQNIVSGFDFINEPNFICAAGEDCINPDNDPMDTLGHGTHVAGTIAAAPENPYGISGTCPNCSIMPLRVCSSAGCSSSAISEAIRYAADHGARVINMSLGSQLMEEPMGGAVSYALLQRNVVVVAAAGNDNTWKPSYPASFDGVISVGAIDAGHKKAWFSNWGQHIKIMAPGQDILSSVPTSVAPAGLAFFSGTSMASPYIAGVVGLMISKNHELTNTEARNALLTNIPNASLFLPDMLWNVGESNPRRALEASGKLGQPKNPAYNYHHGEDVSTESYFDDFGSSVFEDARSFWLDFVRSNPITESPLANLRGWSTLCQGDDYMESEVSGTCKESTKKRVILPGTNDRFDAGIRMPSAEAGPVMHKILTPLIVTDFSFSSTVRIRVDAGIGWMRVCNSNHDYMNPNQILPDTLDDLPETPDCAEIYLTTPIAAGEGLDKLAAHLSWNGSIPYDHGELICDEVSQTCHNKFFSYNRTGSDSPDPREQMYINGIDSKGYVYYNISYSRRGASKSTCVSSLREYKGELYTVGTMCLSGETSTQIKPGQIRMDLGGAIELDYVAASKSDLPPLKRDPTPTPIAQPTLIPYLPTATPTALPTVIGAPGITPTPHSSGTVTPQPTATPSGTSLPGTPVSTPSPTQTPRQDLLNARVVVGNVGKSALVFVNDLGAFQTMGDGYGYITGAVKNKEYKLQVGTDMYTFDQDTIQAPNNRIYVFHGMALDSGEPMCDEISQGYRILEVDSTIRNTRDFAANLMSSKSNAGKALSRAYNRFLSDLAKIPATNWYCYIPQNSCPNGPLEAKNQRAFNSARMVYQRGIQIARKANKPTEASLIRTYFRYNAKYYFGRLAQSLYQCQ